MAPQKILKGIKSGERKVYHPSPVRYSKTHVGSLIIQTFSQTDKSTARWLWKLWLICTLQFFFYHCRFFCCCSFKNVIMDTFQVPLMSFRATLNMSVCLHRTGVCSTLWGQSGRQRGLCERGGRSRSEEKWASQSEEILKHEVLKGVCV